MPDVEIRTLVRTGDTPQAERAGMRKRPPHIVVTTPESLYVLLGSESGRKMLATTRTVIVDEIHALAPNKRGCHLALSLERLEAPRAHGPLPHDADPPRRHERAPAGGERDLFDDTAVRQRRAHRSARAQAANPAGRPAAGVTTVIYSGGLPHYYATRT